jgi:hypothetical protein
MAIISDPGTLPLLNNLKPKAVEETLMEALVRNGRLDAMKVGVWGNWCV